MVNHDILGVAAISDRASLSLGVVAWAVGVLSTSVVGAYATSLAVVLLPISTISAVSACVDKTTNTSMIANFEFGDIFADSNYDASDFMARNHWESSLSPFFTDLMDVGVTNAGV